MNPVHRHMQLTLVAAGNWLSREVLGNVPAASQLVFYLLAGISLLILASGCRRRWRLWQMGRTAGDRPSWSTALRRLTCDVLLQRRMWRARRRVSRAHGLMFYGFVVLLIGTTLIAIEHGLNSLLRRPATEPLFHKGVYFAVYEIVMDAFGIALLLGVVGLARRRVNRPPSLAHGPLDWLVLGALLAIGLTGYAVEGLRIIREQSYLPGFSFVGYLLSRAFYALGVDAESAATLHWGLWWVHAVLALTLIAAFPYTRLLHVIAGAVNLSREANLLGTLLPLSLDEVEATGVVGAGQLRDFTRHQLIMMDACVACGRCEDVCPATEAGKPLSPKSIVQDLRSQLQRVGSTFGLEGQMAGPDGPPAAGTSVHEVISSQSLWSCTTCAACVDVCPLGISPLGMITDMRRNLVGEGQLRGSPALALQRTQRTGNPWGLPADERLDWTAGIDVPTVESCPDFDVLYWVGCAAAYDRRLQRVARAMVRLLQAANVRFAVLGRAERCTGEAARRMGDEFLFQELAHANLRTLAQHQVKKIVTHCPHCVNSLRHDYPQFGGDFQVVHHSEFLAGLVSEGRLQFDPKARAADAGLTYHDPCYLARINHVTGPPRDLLRTANLLPIIEMPRHGVHAACCGAGGGRMWFDDPPQQRIGAQRVREALGTGATTIAVGCPFCLTMISDGVAAESSDVAVKDVAELLADALDATRAS